MIARKRTRKESDRAAFACIWRRVLHNPPITHRNATNNRGRLTVLEFAVAVAAATRARAELSKMRHQAALAAGKKAIRRERRLVRADEFGRLKIAGVSYQFKLAGSDGYMQGAEAFNSSRFTVSIRLSRSELLRAAGLARNGKNNARLTAALRRLTRPVQVGTAKIKGPLESWTVDGPKLRLAVRSMWLPTRHFACVPMPLPTRGSVTLALYLFLFGADLRPDLDTAIRFDRLAQRVGIPLDRPAHAVRSIKAALKRVNAHLAALATHDEAPAGFELLPVDDGARVRILALDKIVAELREPGVLDVIESIGRVPEPETPQERLRGRAKRGEQQAHEQAEWDAWAERLKTGNALS